MRSRQDSLAICKSCKNRSFDMKQGIICSITKDKRYFLEEECPDLIKDGGAIAEKNHKIKKEAKQEVGVLWVGVSAIMVGIIILFIGFSIGVFFRWNIGLLIVGLGLTIRGLYAASQLKKDRSPQERDDLIDSVKK
jgi:hypothetical protein